MTPIFEILYQIFQWNMTASWTMMRPDLMLSGMPYSITMEGSILIQIFLLGTFSSNFIAGRKGSKVFGAVWEAQKAALADHCDDRLKVNEKKVCCSDDLQRRCHIPWAGIGEGISHPVVQKLMKEVRAQKAKVRTFCFEGDDSFVPNYFLEILEKTPNLQDAETAFKRQGVRKASKRIMYHLFASLGFGSNHDGANLFDASTFIGHLY
eukprot:symbB.v1.2.019178.t1/scaffold1558.1/size111825/1